MKVDFGQGEKEVVISVWTLVIYEQEFGSDLVSDVLGVQRFTTGDMLALSTDDVGNPESIEIDYTRHNWTNSIKALWAGLKAADDNVPSFDIWSRQISDSPIDLWSIILEYIPEIRARLFRSGAASSE